MKKRAGILGGSFDPVHEGHVKIACSFLQSGLIDELIVVLTPYPPHKKNRDQADYEHRLKMLELAFKETEHVTVSGVEQQLPKPSYTLQTIEFLQESNPDTLYYLCMGMDSLEQFHQWYKHTEVLEKVDLIVADRPGFDRSGIDPGILEHVIFVEHEPNPVSSTAIRRRDGKMEEGVPDAVAAYIKKYNLYS